MDLLRIVDAKTGATHWSDFFVSGAVRGTDGLVVGISTEKSGCFFLFRVALGLPGDLWLTYPKPNFLTFGQYIKWFPKTV